MQAAVVDRNVLVAWRIESDQNHQRGVEICSRASDGDLPQLWIPRPFLQETIKHVDKEAGWRPAVETYRTLDGDPMFELVNLTENDYRRGYAIFETTYELEFPDAVGLAYMHRVGLEHSYSFDDAANVSRWNVAHDPYAV